MPIGRCQCFVARRALLLRPHLSHVPTPCRVQWRQSLQFGLVGLTLHGPFFYNGFRWLDARFGTAATLQKVRRRLLGQDTSQPELGSSRAVALHPHPHAGCPALNGSSLADPAPHLCSCCHLCPPAGAHQDSMRAADHLSCLHFHVLYVHGAA